MPRDFIGTVEGAIEEAVRRFKIRNGELYDLTFTIPKGHEMPKTEDVVEDLKKDIPGPVVTWDGEFEDMHYRIVKTHERGYVMEVSAQRDLMGAHCWQQSPYNCAAELRMLMEEVCSE